MIVTTKQQVSNTNEVLGLSDKNPMCLGTGDFFDSYLLALHFIKKAAHRVIVDLHGTYWAEFLAAEALDALASVYGRNVASTLW